MGVWRYYGAEIRLRAVVVRLAKNCDMSLIESYLKSCRELARFCSQRGWIDSSSLRFHVIMEFGNELIVEIQFDELIMEGSGNVNERMPCRGQLHLVTDRYGHVIRAEAL